MRAALIITPSGDHIEFHTAACAEMFWIIKGGQLFVQDDRGLMVLIKGESHNETVNTKQSANEPPRL
jgi:hypothetical protein